MRTPGPAILIPQFSFRSSVHHALISASSHQKGRTIFRSENTSNRLRARSIFAFVIVFFIVAEIPAKNMFDWRCFIYTGGVYPDNTRLKELMTHAASWGYNGLWFEQGTFKGITTSKTPVGFRDKLNELLAHGKSLDMMMIPIANGQTSPVFVDTSLAEGWPVKKSIFVVSGATARLSGGDIQLKNGGFEEGFSGWRGMNGPQEPFVIDSTVAWKGKNSLKARMMPDHTFKLGKLIPCYQRLPVRPFCAYELSVMVKTSRAKGGNGNYRPNNNEFVVKASGLPLYKNRDGSSVRTGQSWKRESVMFGTLHHRSIEILVSASSAFIKYGDVWFDDVQIEEIALNHMIRRPSLSVVATKADGTILQEGRDYAVKDGALSILNPSSVSNGDSLFVDWYILADTIYEIPAASFCDWRTWEVVRHQINVFDEWFNHPPIRHMKYGEWRESGWDPACIAKYHIDKVGSGPYMGRVNNITEQLFKEANCNREVTMWNDMWDPFANSLKTYQMVNGGTANSGLELSGTAIIMNWNTIRMKNSMLYFAALHPDYPEKKVAQRQIMNCGMWTGTAEKWLRTLDTLENDHGLPDGAVIGMTYQTFYGPETYHNMENMSLVAKSTGRWGTGPIPVPPKVAGCPAIAPEAAIRGDAHRATTAGLKLTATAFQGGKLRYGLSQDSRIRIVVSDILGRTVQVVTKQKQSAGTHEVRLDALQLSAGVYFVNLSVDGTTQQITRKIALL